MATTEEIEMIEQATLHKLAFVQALLKRKELAFSGTREQVRARCIHHLDSGEVSADELRALLESLDLWGNQRIRLIRVPDAALHKYRDADCVLHAVEHAGFGDIFQGEIPVVVEPQVSPISIRYREEEGVRFLTLIAGRIQDDWLPVTTIPELPYESVAALLQQVDIPDTSVVFRPFKLQRRKIVSFAEFDLDTGHGILSVKSVQATGGYKAKFEEISWAFDPLQGFSDAHTVHLSRAISRIDDPAREGHLHLPRQHLRDEQGGLIRMQASTPKGDVREHPKLRGARDLFTGDEAGDYCDCHWDANPPLAEHVHTLIYGSSGEVSFRGQASEESIRFVLHRIRVLNS